MYDQGQQTPFNQAPTPIPPQDTNFIVPPPDPKKSRKALIATVIVLAVLLIGAIGAIVFLLFFQPKDTSTTNTATDNATAEDSDRAGKLIAKVQAAVSDELKTTYPSMKITNGLYAPAYKPADKDYAVTGSDFGASLSIESTPSIYDQAGQTAIERSINTVLAGEADLKKTESDTQVIYQNKDVICNISIGSSPVFASCANIKEYDSLLSQVAPFADAYLATDQGKMFKEGVAFGAPKITQKSNGYRNATIAISNTEGVGGFAGLFYAKDSNWSFWQGTQSIIPCTDYNTNDLQRAFEGDTCYDTAANATATVKITL